VGRGRYLVDAQGDFGEAGMSSVAAQTMAMTSARLNASRSCASVAWMNSALSSCPHDRLADKRPLTRSAGASLPTAEEAARLGG
jgi:hypothetical protein